MQNIKNKYQNSFEEILMEAEQRIKNYGLCVVATETETPDGKYRTPMAYTVGLSDVGLKDIIVFCMPFKPAQAILNYAAELLKKNELPADQPITELANFPLIFKNVSAEAVEPYMTLTNCRANEPLPAFQMVWPDNKGLFPWEEGFDCHYTFLQPALYDLK